jgi:hypothetical protein
MKVRIRRAPPSRVLEGVDLGPVKFEAGRVYDLEPRVAEVLLVRGYAERVDVEPSSSGAKQFA